MDLVSTFYSKPSNMSAYSMYTRRKSQRGGSYDTWSPDTKAKVAAGTYGLLSGLATAITGYRAYKNKYKRK